MLVPEAAALECLVLLLLWLRGVRCSQNPPVCSSGEESEGKNILSQKSKCPAILSLVVDLCHEDNFALPISLPG